MCVAPGTLQRVLARCGSGDGRVARQEAHGRGKPEDESAVLRTDPSEKKVSLRATKRAPTRTLRVVSCRVVSAHLLFLIGSSDEGLRSWSSASQLVLLLEFLCRDLPALVGQLGLDRSERVVALLASPSLSALLALQLPLRLLQLLLHTTK